MFIISNIVKCFITSLIFFILISFLVPTKRPFADGEVYINSKVYRNTIITDKPYLVIDSMDNIKDLITKVDKWQKSHSHVERIVFVVPRWELIIYYFYFKKHFQQQSHMNKINYELSPKSELWNVRRILTKYKESIGLVMEYFISLFNKNSLDNIMIK